MVLFQSFNLPIDDILDLDKLVEHYQFHSEKHGDNFVVFLSKHYGELKAEHQQQHQEEQQEHEDLPFQQNCHSPSSVVFIASHTLGYSSQPEISLTRTDNFLYNASYSLVLSDGPFQPPQRA